MSKTMLVTGGAASGKTRWAVSYFSACDYVLYLCVTDAVDNDTMNRIEYGNKQNFVEWDIKTNADTNLAEYVTDHKFVILDNLAAYVSKVIGRMCPNPDDMTVELKKEIEQQVIRDIGDIYDQVMVIDGSMIVITLETGFSIMPANREQQNFREILGTVNQRIANMSNEVYLSVSGIQFRIK